jgi:alpha-D-ribose 1-methylphosphonate 5-triphosphate synthase subunit PhnL
MKAKPSLARRAPPRLVVEGLCKSFVLHNQGGIRLDVLDGEDLTVAAGECVVLDGPSGTGKSTFLRCVYGNYKAGAGSILVQDGGTAVDIAAAAPREVLALRRRGIGYVSQFLRAVPRVAAIDVVSEPLRATGTPAEDARARAAGLLARLNIPERLWPLAPATFSGGEQQRVNIARGLAMDYPLLLVDEPTAALDAENRAVVVDLIREALGRGAAVIGIFHDRDVRVRVASRLHRLNGSRKAA